MQEFLDARQYHKHYCKRGNQLGCAFHIRVMKIRLTMRKSKRFSIIKSRHIISVLFSSRSINRSGKRFRSSWKIDSPSLS